MQKFQTAQEAIKFMLKWKSKNGLGLKFLYNLSVMHLDSGFIVRFDDLMGENVVNGLKFYLDYTSRNQKKLTGNEI